MSRFGSAPALVLAPAKTVAQGFAIPSDKAEEGPGTLVKKQVALGTKLLIGVGALLLMLIVLSAGALYSIGSMETALDTSAATGTKMEISGELTSQLHMLRANARGMMMYAAVKDTSRMIAEADMLNQRASAVSQLLADIKPRTRPATGRYHARTIPAAHAG
jgi:hypothetical protein